MDPQPAVIAGWFDPLTAETAAAVESIANAHRGAPMMAIVLTGEKALLPADARAILIASLRTVTHVTIAGEHNWRALLPENFKGLLYDDPQGDAERTRNFVDLIVRKEIQPAPAAGTR